MKRNIIILALLALCVGAGAQSKSFTLGKWTEIQGSILKELNRSYVDSLPIDRIERAGVNAMLGSLDPYTVYIPQEENEDLEMMISKTYGGIGAVIYKPDTDGNVIINEPYEGSPAAKNGLTCGDEIIAMLFSGMEFELFDEFEAEYRCNCNEDRYMRALTTLNPHDWRELKDAGEPVETSCLFCGKKYRFELDAIESARHEALKAKAKEIVRGKQKAKEDGEENKQ